MANHKSALKRAKQNETRRLRNKATRTRTKNATKSVHLALNDDSSEDAVAKLNEAKAVIDNAAKKGVIHKNTAARKISRLTKLVNSSAS